MSTARRIAGRLYGDYLLPSRLREYELLLSLALTASYETLPLGEFARREELPERVLLMRHDIDSDLATAARMWRIEQRLGVRGTWFFRLSTWADDLIAEIAAAGSEVGYHYEELATLVKQRGAGTAAQARALIVPARARLQMSLAELRARSGLALDVLAAHGDFANRVVGVASVELLADPEFRQEIGVRLEAYDIENRVSARSSDSVVRTYWWPQDPVEALRRGERVIELLLHPRAWGAAPVANARADLQRLREGCTYRLRRLRPVPR